MFEISNTGDAISEQHRNTLNFFGVFFVYLVFFVVLFFHLRAYSMLSVIPWLF